MTLNEYQRLAQRTSNKGLSPANHLLNGVMGLCGEAGECADLVKKHFWQDSRKISDHLLEELGDVLWYVVETATAMGWELDEVAKTNIDKLKKRYPKGFSVEKSVNRGQ